VGDVADANSGSLVKAGKLRATCDFSAVADPDTVNICVPTPLRKTKDPDMSFIVSACAEIAKFFHPGMLVILESTTYPGTTDELVLPMLEQGGLKAGQDFFLCFSPERVDPGNPQYNTSNIPKVVGVITPLPIAPRRALDIGCRTGHNTVWLSQQGFEVFGVDASEIAIEKAKAKASEALS